MQEAEGRSGGGTALSEAVARSYFLLMAYKDEYEVARLYSDGRFLKQLTGAFEGDYELKFHLAPPLLTKRNPETGLRDKTTYGAWMLPGMRVLAKLKGLRGTVFDVFGYSEERRTERRMIGEYEAMIDAVIGSLSHDNHALAVQIASLPEGVRGYGHVKERHIAEVAAEKAASLSALISATPLDWEGTAVSLSVSYGVYSFTGTEDAGEALQRADQAMYEQKQSRAAGE